MQLRIPLQRAEYNGVRDNFSKIKPKLPFHNNIPLFSGRHDEVFYILVSIKHHVSKDVDSGHYVCDVLY